MNYFNGNLHVNELYIYILPLRLGVTLICVLFKNRHLSECRVCLLFSSEFYYHRRSNNFHIHNKEFVFHRTI